MNNEIPRWYIEEVKREKFYIHATWAVIVIILLCILYSISRPRWNSKDLTAEDIQELQDLKDSSWPPQ